jgi:hypothetical protein
LPLNLTKKSALRKKHALKLLSIYGATCRTKDFEFKNCQKFLYILLLSTSNLYTENMRKSVKWEITLDNGLIKVDLEFCAI